jgi:hypothetical protein
MVTNRKNLFANFNRGTVIIGCLVLILIVVIIGYFGSNALSDLKTQKEQLVEECNQLQRDIAYYKKGLDFQASLKKVKSENEKLELEKERLEGLTPNIILHYLNIFFWLGMFLGLLGIIYDRYIKPLNKKKFLNRPILEGIDIAGKKLVFLKRMEKCFKRIEKNSFRLGRYLSSDFKDSLLNTQTEVNRLIKEYNSYM